MYGSLSPTYAHEKNPEPLGNPELRDILLRLNQLLLAWDEIDLLRKTIAQNEEFNQRERVLASLEVEVEQKRSALAEKEAAIQKERAFFYEQAFERLTRKDGFACAVKKVLTAGLARCS